MAREKFYITCNSKHTVCGFKAKIKEATGLGIKTIHDAILYSEDEGKMIYYILSDQTHLFVYKQLKKTFYAKKETFIQKLVHFSMEDNYVLKKGLTKQDMGLFYYNMNDVIQKINEETLKTLNFTQVSVGLNNVLYYNMQENRLGYFSSVSNITVLPLLHINFIKFLGINSPEQYIVYKVDKDKFMALHESGKIQTWSLISGKLLFQKQTDPSLFDITGFVNFASLETEVLKKNKALLISEEAIEDSSLEDYFQPHQLIPNLDSQKTFVRSQASEIYHFKHIEIVSEEKMELIFEFYHPKYEY